MERITCVFLRNELIEFCSVIFRWFPSSLYNIYQLDFLKLWLSTVSADKSVEFSGRIGAEQSPLHSPNSNSYSCTYFTFFFSVFLTDSIIVILHLYCKDLKMKVRLLSDSNDVYDVFRAEIRTADAHFVLRPKCLRGLCNMRSEGENQIFITSWWCILDE